MSLQAAAQEGDTAPPALEDVVDLHFVALVNRNSRLVELDGRKSFPIDHGKTTDSTLLQVRHSALWHKVYFLLALMCVMASSSSCHDCCYMQQLSVITLIATNTFHDHVLY